MKGLSTMIRKVFAKPALVSKHVFFI